MSLSVQKQKKQYVESNILVAFTGFICETTQQMYKQL